MPLGVDYIYFDMAVNAGPARAAILLQRALGVTADGRIGPVTAVSSLTTLTTATVQRTDQVDTGITGGISVFAALTLVLAACAPVLWFFAGTLPGPTTSRAWSPPRAAAR